MHLSIQKDELVLDLGFWEKVWGMHGAFKIPLRHIKEIKEGTPPSTWKELRIPGTFVPGLIKAGTYYTYRGKEFWYVTRGEKKMITIELASETYKRLVLSLEIHDHASQSIIHRIQR